MTTLHSRATDWLRELIETEFPEETTRLPSINALCQMFAARQGQPIAIMTFRQAMLPLREEGIIVVGQGRGIFVRRFPGVLPSGRRGQSDTISVHPNNSTATLASNRVAGAARSFGTSDRMEVIDLGDRVQFEFVAGNRFDVPNRILVLTKFPAQLIEALKIVERASERTIIEFAGEHYAGRACLFPNSNVACSLVFLFPPPGSIGYLIHLSKQNLEYLIDRLSRLPVSPHPTD